MRKQLVAVAMMILGLAGTLAWAGDQVEVDFRFAFMVDGKQMPAGSYVVQVNGDRVVIKDPKGGAGTEVTVVTRQ